MEQPSSMWRDPWFVTGLLFALVTGGAAIIINAKRLGWL